MPSQSHQFSSKCRFYITAEINPNMILPGTHPLYTPICVFSRRCGCMSDVYVSGGRGNASCSSIRVSAMESIYMSALCDLTHIWLLK